ncbi:MAG: nucleoside deaminase [Spirochaetales bacterium]|nr:nucleoside deaminase [Spirochaetales bacterium]
MPFKTEKETQQDLQLLRIAAEQGRLARSKGNHPFGAILANEQGEVLLKSENTVNTEHNDCGHAETNLMISAVKKYERDFLKNCTLYTSVEPCAMCAGAIYWGNVRRVVYGISESQLLEMTGDDEENQTLALPCREVFARGQKEIIVIGPVEDRELREEIARDHQGFWNQPQAD